MLLVPMQDLGVSTSMTMIIITIVFLFLIPVICKIIHVIRVQVNKIRNADIWGGNQGDLDDEDDDEY